MVFRVRVLPRNVCFDIDANETILDAALRQKFQPPFSCQQAACGTCRARLISGQVFYADDLVLAGLSPQELQDGYILPCCAEAKSDLLLQWPKMLIADEFVARKKSATVLSISSLSPDIHRVILRLSDLDTAKFHAGQYLFLIMPDGSLRAFSIASSPLILPELHLHIRAPQGHIPSEEVLQLFHQRQIISVEMPHGYAWLRNNDRPILMIAGGTGYAPMKSMIDTLIAQQSTRSVHLFWGARDQDALYEDHVLKNLAMHHPRFHYQGLIGSDDPLSMPHLAAAAHFSDLSQFDIYCSGGMEMARAVFKDYRQRSVLPEHFFSDLIDIAKEQGEQLD